MSGSVLTDMVNGLRTVFAGVVGGDLQSNPHLLTRSFAKGVTIVLTVLGIDDSNPTGNEAVPIAGVTVSVQISVQNPDQSWSPVSVIVGNAPTATDGTVTLSDTTTVFDLTAIYQISARAVFPDGSSDSAALPLWPRAGGGSWGMGFTPSWLTAFVQGTPPSSQGVGVGVYPTTGKGAAAVQGVAVPSVDKAGLSFQWFAQAPGETPSWITTGRKLQATFYSSVIVYCQMTDGTTTYSSPSIAITVT
jgi:hypothetical protein